MVQILPQATNLGAQLGQALGGGLEKGIQQGSNVGFQRGLLQNALKGLENIPKNSSPFELASALMQATAGIPGSERYVGQLFPLLLGQLRSQQAFGGEQGPEAGGSPASAPFAPGTQEGQGISSQSVTPNAQQSPGGKPGGILGSIIPQDQIASEAQRYASATGTGLEGASQMQNYLLQKNQVALQQRAMAEQKALEQGVSREDIPLFLQVGQKHQNAATLDDWVRNTNRDFREYKNLSKSLDSAMYPGFFRGLVTGPAGREGRLKTFDNTVKRLVNLGFEPEVRNKLANAQLSPTEIEERIHPFTDQTKAALNRIPHAGPLGKGPSETKDKDVMEFLKKNVNPDTSLLAIRQRLWQDKGYDWQKISQLMNQALDPNKLTTSQVNELGILEREPPRQSLNYIFSDWGNFLKATAGQK